VDIKNKLKQNAQGPRRAVVLGFFNISEDQAYGFDETATIEGYSIDPWGQFQASADFLRG